MPDISMCKNKSCLIKDKCYRYTAIPNPHRQSYANFEPVKGEIESNYCNNFMNNGLSSAKFNIEEIIEELKQ